MSKRNEREFLFGKYGGRCAYCGIELQKGWHIDHREPIRRSPDGTCLHPELDILDNKELSCPSCNINKHSMTLEHFRSTIVGYVESMNKRMTQYKMAKKYGLIKETRKPLVFYFETINPPNTETNTKHGKKNKNK